MHGSEQRQRQPAVPLHARLLSTTHTSHRPKTEPPGAQPSCAPHGASATDRAPRTSIPHRCRLPPALRRVGPFQSTSGPAGDGILEREAGWPQSEVHPEVHLILLAPAPRSSMRQDRLTAAAYDRVGARSSGLEVMGPSVRNTGDARWLPRADRYIDRARTIGRRRNARGGCIGLEVVARDPSIDMAVRRLVVADPFRVPRHTALAASPSR